MIIQGRYQEDFLLAWYKNYFFVTLMHNDIGYQRHGRKYFKLGIYNLAK
jgi:hypothetical protein